MEKLIGKSTLSYDSNKGNVKMNLLRTSLGRVMIRKKSEKVLISFWHNVKNCAKNLMVEVEAKKTKNALK